MKMVGALICGLVLLASNMSIAGESPSKPEFFGADAKLPLETRLKLSTNSQGDQGDMFFQTLSGEEDLWFDDENPDSLVRPFQSSECAVGQR